MVATDHPLAARILELIPINGLDPDLQQEVLAKGEIQEIKRRKTVFEMGARDAFTFYLLDGELELESDSSSPVPMRAGDDNARRALAQLQPRRYTARARTPVQVFRIERAMLDYILSDEQVLERDTEMQVAELETSEDEADWMSRLLSSAMFARLPPDNIQKFFSELEPMEVAAGDLVVEQGTEGDYLYIIAEGQCTVSRRAPRTGQDVTLATLREGDSFGEEALISNTPRNASVTMAQDGFLMRLSKRSFEELVSKPTLKPVPWSEARDRVDKGAHWLDVRFADEHGTSAIAHSLNIPLNVLRLETTTLDRANTYVLYCDTGARSSTGAFLLAREGFDAYYLAGGLDHIPEGEDVPLVSSSGKAPSTPVATGQDTSASDTAAQPGLAIAPDTPDAPTTPATSQPDPQAALAELEDAAQQIQSLVAERDRATGIAQKAADSARSLKRRYDELYRAAHQERSARRNVEKEFETFKAEAERRSAMEEARLKSELDKTLVRARDAEKVLHSQREALAEERVRLEQETAATRGDNERIRGELKELEALRLAQEAESRDRLQSLREELEAERKRARSSNEQLSQLREELQQTQLSSNELARSQADMEQALQQNLESTRQELLDERTELAEGRKALEREIEALANERAELARARGEHQHAVDAGAEDLARRASALDERESAIEELRSETDLDIARRTATLAAEDARLSEDKLAWRTRIDEAIEAERQRLESSYEDYKNELTEQARKDVAALIEQHEAEAQARYEARQAEHEAMLLAHNDAITARTLQRTQLERSSFEARMSALTRVYEVRLAEQAAILQDEQRQMATGTVRLREALNETERLKQELRQARSAGAAPKPVLLPVAVPEAETPAAPPRRRTLEPMRPSSRRDGSAIPVLEDDLAVRRTTGGASDERARVLSSDQIAAIRQKMQEKLDASRRGSTQ